MDITEQQGQETGGESDLDSMLGAVEEGLGLSDDAPPEEKAEQEGQEGQSSQEKAPAKAASAEGEAPQPGAPAEPAPPTAKAPSSWKPEETAGWEQLPPHVQAAIHRRETDFHNQLAVQKDHVAVSEGVNKIIGPYAQVFRDFNINPFDHIATLLNTHAMLSFGTPEQKAQILSDIARQVGFDPSTLASGKQPTYDPKQVEVLSKVTNLERTFGAVVNHLNEATVSKLEGEIDAFSRQPENRYFAEVLPDMIASMQRNPNQTLKECYEAAVAANPITRAKEVDRLAGERAAKMAAEAAEKARKAKRATAANVSSNQSRSRATPGDDWEADLHSTLADIRSRE